MKSYMPKRQVLRESRSAMTIEENSISSKKLPNSPESSTLLMPVELHGGMVINSSVYEPLVNRK